MLHDVTPLILTWNEEANLERSLARLSWANQVVIVDSFSTDRTEEIAKRHPNVRWIQRAFDNHTDQWNHGVDAIKTPWVLAMDADYVLDEGFEDELAATNAPRTVNAYFARFRYLIHGRSLSASLYPPRAVLFRKSGCRYIQDGHTQTLNISGETGWLNSLIAHDDRKPLSRWFSSQAKYAALEAEKLLSIPVGTLRIQDRLRRTGWAAIPATFLYTLLAKRTLLDGWPGWYYTLQRTLAEVMLALEILERRLAPARKPGASNPES